MASEKRRDNQGRLLPTNVTQRSNGTYQYSYTLNGTRHFCYSKSLSGIKQKMAEIQQDIQSGISTKNPILNDYFSDFMETVKKPRLKESSYNAQMDSWNLYVRDGLGRKRVKDVRRTDIIRALNDLILKKGLSRGTVNIVQAVICDCLDAAMKDNLIPNNPSSGISRELAKGKDAKVKKIITPAQAQRLFDYMNSSQTYSVYVPMFVLMFNTGMRISETLGLTWSDCDLHNGTISVNHEVIYRKHGDKIGFYISTPKTKSSIRTIPLTKDAKAALLTQRQNNMMLGLPDVEIDGHSDFIFKTRCGEPRTVSQINQVLYKVIDGFNEREKELAESEHREPEYLPRISSHSFRHSFATALCKSTSDIKSVQSLLGHSNVNTTLNTYVAATEGRKQEAMTVFENRLQAN